MVKIFIFLKLLFISLTIALSLAAQAQDSEPFHQRIEIIRNNKRRLRSLRLRENKFIFSEHIRELNFLVTSLQKNSDFKYKTLENMLQSQSIQNWTPKQKSTINKTINFIKDPKLVKAFENSKLHSVMNRIEQEMNIVFFEFNTLAIPYQPFSFYRSDFAEQFILWAGDFAASQMRLNPAANLAKYLALRLVNFALERRSYFQNYIIHYLEKIGPEKLGLTKEEGRLIVSSIYSTKIEWYEFWEALKLKTNWSNFGSNSLKREFSTCTTRFKKYYDSKNKYQHYDYKFTEVVSSNSSKVFNFLNRKSRLSNAPSLAYSESDPNQLLVERILFEVIKMSLEISPIPGVATAPLNWFINSMYKNQTLNEGALLAHYESMGEFEHANIVIRQSLNPFITSLTGAKSNNERISHSFIQRLGELK